MALSRQCKKRPDEYFLSPCRISEQVRANSSGVPLCSTRSHRLERQPLFCMTDYLQPVGRRLRVASIVCCLLASILSSVLAVILWTDMLSQNSFYYEGKPVWIGALVLTGIGVAAGFIAWRVLRSRTAANGVTVLPVWFIQLFGVIFLVGLILVAYHRGSVVFAIEGVIVAFAMIFVGRYIAQKRNV